MLAFAHVLREKETASHGVIVPVLFTADIPGINSAGRFVTVYPPFRAWAPLGFPAAASPSSTQLSPDSIDGHHRRLHQGLLGQQTHFTSCASGSSYAIRKLMMKLACLRLSAPHGFRTTLHNALDSHQRGNAWREVARPGPWPGPRFTSYLKLTCSQSGHVQTAFSCRRLTLRKRGKNMRARFWC